MNRRVVMALIGGAAAVWPRAARAQQPAMPVIGFLSSLSQEQTTHLVAALRRGLNEIGYVEGQNLAIENRYADGQYDRLPGMATDLIRRPVGLIVAAGPPAALAARTATTTVPI